MTRPPSPPLMSLDEAIAQLLAATPALDPPEDVDSFQALGRVLAEDLVAALDVPGRDNSAMDGYALRRDELRAPGGLDRWWPVLQRIPAGHPGQPLEPGSVARVFTGAEIPPGADAVIPQEQAEVQAEGVDGLPRVRFTALPEAGAWIRRQGEDLRRGATVLPAGTRLGAAALGLAASLGRARLRVSRRPRVALMSSGDELVAPGSLEPAALPPGSLFNSNRHTLRGLLQAAGAEVSDLGIIPDRLEATRAALRAAALGHDLILSSGGVSVGEEDHLRPAVQAEGRLALWQVAMKPGKPLAFGAVRRADAPAGARGPAAEALFIGLPGNPVASFVTFLLAVRPVLRALEGEPYEPPRALAVPAGFDWPRPDRRREFLRARLDAGGQAIIHANQSSGVLSSAAWAEGLVDLAPGRVVRAGEAVPFLPYAALL